MTADPIPLSDGAPIRVLLIEDDDKDYQRICDLLDAARHVTFAVDRAQSVEDAMARLGMDACDIWLVDHGLPDGKGLDVVRAAHDRGLRAPIVMLTGCAFSTSTSRPWRSAPPTFSTRTGSTPPCWSAPSATRWPGIVRPSA